MTSQKQSKIWFIAFLVAVMAVLLIILVCLRFNKVEPPQHQIGRLMQASGALTGRLLSGYEYSVKVTEHECYNEGKQDFELHPLTIACSYTTDIHTTIGGQLLRERIEKAGGWRNVYDDGSGADYLISKSRLNYSCQVSDRVQYHDRYSAEHSLSDGHIYISCQSQIGQNNSPIKLYEHVEY